MLSSRIAMLLAAILVWSVPVGRTQTPRRIEIIASRFTYTPDEITLKKDETVVLVMHSADVTHGFQLIELNIKAEIKKGKNTEIKFTPAAAGQFVGKCAFFCGAGHASMMLHINVVE
jgi:cytochrome c oxidase subunit 2